MEKKNRRNYTCPGCQKILGDITLVGRSPETVYQIVAPGKPLLRSGSDVAFWPAALKMAGPFTAREMYATYKEMRNAALIVGRPYVYNTARVCIQNWLALKWVIKCKETREVLTACPFCKQPFGAHAIAGSHITERKSAASAKTLSERARPMHIAKKQGEVWKVLSSYEGEFYAREIHKLVTGDISLTTVRLEIRKAVAEGKLEVVSFGIYKRKEDDQTQS